MVVASVSPFTIAFTVDVLFIDSPVSVVVVPLNKAMVSFVNRMLESNTVMLKWLLIMVCPSSNSGKGVGRRVLSLTRFFNVQLEFVKVLLVMVMVLLKTETSPLTMNVSSVKVASKPSPY